MGRLKEINGWGPRNKWLVSREAMAGAQAINGRYTGNHEVWPRIEMGRFYEIKGTGPRERLVGRRKSLAVRQGTKGGGPGNQRLGAKGTNGWGP